MKKKILKQVLGILMSGAMIVYLPVSAYANTYDIENGDITVVVSVDEQSNTVYKVNGEVDTTSVILTGSSNLNTVNIEAQAGANAFVTLHDLTIDVSNTNNAIAFKTTGAGSVTVKLDGENTLKSGKNSAGLQKENTGKLTIKGDNTTSGRLTAQGGQNGAGIGSGHDQQSLTSTGTGVGIVIAGGEITATGGTNGAGIGGGRFGAGEVTISGGTVISAQGGTNGAGIGGGQLGAGEVTISGGTVTSVGGKNAAGIGGGRNGAGEVTISGGTVTSAQGGESGAGIGGGYYGNGEVTISGGTVTSAQGGDDGAGIGGGWNGAGEVTISGGTVTSAGGERGAGIGGGYNAATSSSVTVKENAVVFAAGGTDDEGHTGAALGTGVTFNNNTHTYTNGTEEVDTTGLYTTGSITRFAAGTSVQDMTDHPENAISGVNGTIQPPVVPVNPVESANKDVVFKTPEKKPVIIEYTERSCIADVNVSALIEAALKADPGTKEITIEFNDNICLTADIMKDLLADSRVAKNCMFSYEGKRYDLYIPAVSNNTAAYKAAFDALAKEPNGMAGFMRMAELFEKMGVTLTLNTP